MTELKLANTKLTRPVVVTGDSKEIILALKPVGKCNFSTIEDSRLLCRLLIHFATGGSRVWPVSIYTTV